MRLNPEYRAIIDRIAPQYDLEPDLVEAVCLHESDGGDPLAVRIEPGFYKRYTEPMSFSATEEWCRAMSWGLMQVMGQVAREYGFKGCYLTGLLDPETNITYGCRHLANKIKKYGRVDYGLAAYNAGSCRRDEAGSIVNQKYIDAVMAHYKTIKA